MNLLQMYCTLLQKDMNDHLRSRDPEGWDSMMETVRELKAVAEGAPAGDLAMGALAEMFPQYRHAVTVETALRDKDAGTGAQTGTAPVGTESAVPHSAILTALAQMATGTQPEDGSTAEEALQKALLAIDPAAQTQAMIQQAAWEAGMPVETMLENLAARNPKEVAALPLSPMQSLRLLGIREEQRKHGGPRTPDIITPAGPAHYLTVPPGHKESGDMTAMRDDPDQSANLPGALRIVSPDSGESPIPPASAEPAPQDSATPSDLFDPAHSPARQVWHTWQARKEAEELAASSTATGEAAAATAFPATDQSLRMPGSLPGKLPQHILTNVTRTREFLDLIETTPLSFTSGRAATGPADMTGNRTITISGVTVNASPDRNETASIAAAVFKRMLRREFDAATDQFDDGVWA